jgi:hypothetical protein
MGLREERVRTMIVFGIIFGTGLLLTLVALALLQL